MSKELRKLLKNSTFLQIIFQASWNKELPSFEYLVYGIQSPFLKSKWYSWKNEIDP